MTPPVPTCASETRKETPTKKRRPHPNPRRRQRARARVHADHNAATTSVLPAELWARVFRFVGKPADEDGINGLASVRLACRHFSELALEDLAYVAWLRTGRCPAFLREAAGAFDHLLARLEEEEAEEPRAALALRWRRLEAATTLERSLEFRKQYPLDEKAVQDLNAVIGTAPTRNVARRAARVVLLADVWGGYLERGRADLLLGPNATESTYVALLQMAKKMGHPPTVLSAASVVPEVSAWRWPHVRVVGSFFFEAVVCPVVEMPDGTIRPAHRTLRGNDALKRFENDGEACEYLLDTGDTGLFDVIWETTSVYRKWLRPTPTPNPLHPFACPTRVLESMIRYQKRRTLDARKQALFAHAIDRVLSECLEPRKSVAKWDVFVERCLCDGESAVLRVLHARGMLKPEATFRPVHPDDTEGELRVDDAYAARLCAWTRSNTLPNPALGAEDPLSPDHPLVADLFEAAHPTGTPASEHCDRVERAVLRLEQELICMRESYFWAARAIVRAVTTGTVSAVRNVLRLLRFCPKETRDGTDVYYCMPLEKEPSSPDRFLVHFPVPPFPVRLGDWDADELAAALGEWRVLFLGLLRNHLRRELWNRESECVAPRLARLMTLSGARLTEFDRYLLALESPDPGYLEGVMRDWVAARDKETAVVSGRRPRPSDFPVYHRCLVTSFLKDASPRCLGLLEVVLKYRPALDAREGWSEWHAGMRLDAFLGFDPEKFRMASRHVVDFAQWHASIRDDLVRSLLQDGPRSEVQTDSVFEPTA